MGNIKGTPLDVQQEIDRSEDDDSLEGRLLSCDCISKNEGRYVSRLIERLVVHQGEGLEIEEKKSYHWTRNDKFFRHRMGHS